MLDSITLLMKSGKLKDAVEQLHQYALGRSLDSETLADIVVLSGSISELAKQEKRRKISPQEALDLKTRYAFELADLIDTLRGSNPSLANPTVSNNPVNTGQPYPGFNNNINVTVNLSIENKITVDIKNNIRGLAEGISELKDELKEIPDEEAAVALQEIEALDESLQEIQHAEKKEDLPPSLKKVEAFLKRVEDGNDYVAKAFKLTKKGVETLQKIGKNYNAIAEWVGLPQVPKIFL